MPAIHPLHHKTLVALFEKDGFTFDRQRGDHLIYVKPGVTRPLVIPAYHEVPVFISKNLLRSSGMTREIPRTPSGSLSVMPPSIMSVDVIVVQGSLCSGAS